MNLLPMETQFWLHDLGVTVGAAALYGLAAQFVLAARLKPLDRLMGLHRVMLLHRWLGAAICLVVLFHPLLVFVDAGHPASQFFAWSQWPQVLGACVIVSLWFLAAFARWRAFAGLPYDDPWKALHRWGALGLGAAAVTHAVFVTPPEEALGVAAACLAGMALVLRRVLLKTGRAYTVQAVTPAGKDAHELVLAPVGEAIRHAMPGQFAFLTPVQSRLPRQEHPFTIASTPWEGGGEEALRFTIRCSGDWTDRIGLLAPGDRVHVDGAYGRFSHQALAREGELVFVAGGVGITPFLSMLRRLRAEDAGRKVTLVWVNRGPADLVHAEEFFRMEQEMPGLRVLYVYTREAGQDGRFGRPDREMLAELLEGADPKAAHFVCGPPAMMDAAIRDLKALKRRRVYAEAFSL